MVDKLVHALDKRLSLGFDSSAVLLTVATSRLHHLLSEFASVLSLASLVQGSLEISLPTVHRFEEMPSRSGDSE